MHWFGSRENIFFCLPEEKNPQGFQSIFEKREINSQKYFGTAGSQMAWGPFINGWMLLESFVGVKERKMKI